MKWLSLLLICTGLFLPAQELEPASVDQPVASEEAVETSAEEIVEETPVIEPDNPEMLPVDPINEAESVPASVPLVSGSEAPVSIPESESMPVECVLTIEDCIMLAVLANRDVREAWLQYSKTENDVGIDRADYLPQIDLNYDYSNAHNDSSGTKSLDRSGSISLSQRIFEFGKEANDLVSTRDTIRSELYDLRSQLSSVITNVRRDFFSLLLKEAQIRERRHLLREFEENLLIARAKYEKGQILEIDVFTMELNVLNEQLRINELERTILKKKMDLRFRLGCRIPLEFQVTGEREPLVITEEAALELARQNSYLLELKRDQIDEAKRELGEYTWEYMPQLTFQMGYDTYQNSIDVDLTQSGYVWGVDLSAESFWQVSDSRRATYTDDDMEDMSVSFQIKLPLFDGFRRREDREKDDKDLRILKLDYLDTREDLERDVLKDYQDYYERRERMEIVRRRVEIAKTRLSINEKLKEFGKIDDNQLETFRNAFFNQQDSLYAEQDAMISAEEDIRRYLFEPDPYIRMLESPEQYYLHLENKNLSPIQEDDYVQ